MSSSHLFVLLLTPENISGMSQGINDHYLVSILDLSMSCQKIRNYRKIRGTGEYQNKVIVSRFIYSSHSKNEEQMVQVNIKIKSRLPLHQLISFQKRRTNKKKTSVANLSPLPHCRTAGEFTKETVIQSLALAPSCLQRNILRSPVERRMLRHPRHLERE